MLNPKYQPISDEINIENYNSFIPERWAYIFNDMFKSKDDAFTHLQNAICADGDFKLEVEHVKSKKETRTRRQSTNGRDVYTVIIPGKSFITGKELNRYESKHLVRSESNESESIEDLMMVLASVLATVKDLSKKNGKKISQEEIVAHIEEHYRIPFFGESKIKNLFSIVNKKLR